MQGGWGSTDASRDLRSKQIGQYNCAIHLRGPVQVSRAGEISRASARARMLLEHVEKQGCAHERDAERDGRMPAGPRRSRVVEAWRIAVFDVRRIGIGDC